MTQQSFLNNYRDELQADITDTDFQMILSDVSRIDAAVNRGNEEWPIRLTLAPADNNLPTLSEVEVVIADRPDVANNTVDLERGQEGTTAKSWSAGAVVGARATAGAMEGFRRFGSLDEQIAAQPALAPRSIWWTDNPQTDNNGNPAFGPVGGDYNFVVSSSYVDGNNNLSFGSGHTIDGDDNLLAGSSNYADAKNSLIVGSDNESQGGRGSILFGDTNYQGYSGGMTGGRNNTQKASRSGTLGEDNRNIGSNSFAVGASVYNADASCFVSGGAYYSLTKHYSGEATVARCRQMGVSGDTTSTGSYYGPQFHGNPSAMAIAGEAIASDGNYQAFWTFSAIARAVGNGTEIVGKTVTLEQYNGDADLFGLDVVAYDNYYAYSAKVQATGVSGRDVDFVYNLRATRLQQLTYNRFNIYS